MVVDGDGDGDGETKEMLVRSVDSDGAVRCYCGWVWVMSVIWCCRGYWRKIMLTVAVAVAERW